MRTTRDTHERDSNINPTMTTSVTSGAEAFDFRRQRVEDQADGRFVVPTEGPQRWRVAAFFSVVAGAECASVEFVHDHRVPVVSIQHPGKGGTGSEPTGQNWPDGGLKLRPTVMQVWKTDGGRINS